LIFTTTIFKAFFNFGYFEKALIKGYKKKQIKNYFVYSFVKH